MARGIFRGALPLLASLALTIILSSYAGASSTYSGPYISSLSTETLNPGQSVGMTQQSFGWAPTLNNPSLEGPGPEAIGAVGLLQNWQGYGLFILDTSWGTNGALCTGFDSYAPGFCDATTILDWEADQVSITGVSINQEHYNLDNTYTNSSDPFVFASNPAYVGQFYDPTWICNPAGSLSNCVAPSPPLPPQPVSITYNVPNHDDFALIQMECGALLCTGVSIPSGCVQKAALPAAVYTCANQAPGSYSVTATPVYVINQISAIDYNPPETNYWPTGVEIDAAVYTPSIPKASVLIVTEGVGDGSCSTPTMAAYNAVLVKQGLSSLCVDLDDDMYTNLTGQIPIVNPVSDWTYVKEEINILEAGTGAQYLVILGDGNVVPMPSISAKGAITIMALKEVGAPSEVPTDDPYGSLTPVNHLPNGDITAVRLQSQLGEYPAATSPR